MDIAKLVTDINQTLAAHSLWDGYWIHSFKRKTLSIGASFDRSRGRLYDIVFKQVDFFNLPAQWRDTDTFEHDLLRLSTVEEFSRHHADLVPEGSHVFAIDLMYPRGALLCKLTHFVVAPKLYFFRTQPPHDQYGAGGYVDPLASAAQPCLINRVTQSK